MITKEVIKKKIIKTQSEWESHIENILYLFDKNISTYNPDSLLDVGCGSGERTIRIANNFNIDMHNTYGVDCNNQHVIACRKIFNAKVIDLESDNLAYQDNNFDLVICNQVLEHLKNYKKVIDDIIRVTREKGYIIIGIPNLAHLINRIFLIFGIQPMCIHLDSSHVRGFTHKAFVEMLNSLRQVELIDYTGSLMFPFPYYIAKYLSRYLVGLSGYTCYLLQKIH